MASPKQHFDCVYLRSVKALEAPHHPLNTVERVPTWPIEAHQILIGVACMYRHHHDNICLFATHLERVDDTSATAVSPSSTHGFTPRRRLASSLIMLPSGSAVPHVTQQ